MITRNLYEWYQFGGHIPRKLKKKILGKKIRMRELRKMLRETVCGDPIRTMYERVRFTPHGDFCPSCGEKNYVGSGNRASYPEYWEEFYCIRCRGIVGYIDNSPFVHALECKDSGYNPTF